MRASTTSSTGPGSAVTWRPMHRTMSSWWAAADAISWSALEATTETSSAPVGQMTGGHQSPTPVASRPGEHNHSGRGEAAHGQVGKTPPRVLHHLGQLDVEVLHHDSVDLAHLISGQRGDRLDDESSHTRCPPYRALLSQESDIPPTHSSGASFYYLTNKPPASPPFRIGGSPWECSRGRRSTVCMREIR